MEAKTPTSKHIAKASAPTPRSQQVNKRFASSCGVDDPIQHPPTPKDHTRRPTPHAKQPTERQTTPNVTLPAESFPHIFDAILANLDTQGRIRMRATSRRLRRQMNDVLFKRVGIIARAWGVRSEAPIILVDPAPPRVTPNGRQYWQRLPYIPSKLVVKLKLHDAAVLELIDNHLDNGRFVQGLSVGPGAEFIMDYTECRAPAVVRRHMGYESPGFPLLHAETTVDIVMPDTKRLLSPVMGRKHVVQFVCRKGSRAIPDPYHRFRAKELVVVFSLEAGVTAGVFNGDEAPGIIGFYGDFAWKGLYESVTLVGLDTVTSFPSAAWQSVINQWRPGFPLFALTEREYIAQIGSETWRLEMGL